MAGISFSATSRSPFSNVVIELVEMPVYPNPFDNRASSRWPFARSPKLIERGHSHKKYRRHRTYGAVPNGVSSPVPAHASNY